MPDANAATAQDGTPGRAPAYTDDGNATLLLNTHGHQLRYNHDRERWHTWDGKKWATQPKGGGTARELAKQVMRNYNTTNNEAARKHQKKSLSNAGITALLAMAQTDPRARINAQDLDNHPDQLNTPTGITNLHTGHTTPHNPEMLHTRITNHGPDPTMPTPIWNSFLNDTFQGNQALTAYFQRVCGYAATGYSHNAILPFLFGGGANGKSVAIEVLLGLLGDYADPVARGLLTTGPKAHPTEMADLLGLRLGIASEFEEDDQFDEGKTKLLTGGDRIKARYMGKDFFSFTPTHTLMVMANYQPKVASGGDSFWRRLRIIPFNHRVPEGDKVEGLAQILLDEEGPGIMAWLVQGAVNALADGLQDPAEVFAATHQYAEEEDTIGQFLADRCHFGNPDQLRVNTTDLLHAYTNWCKENRTPEISAQAFGRRIKAAHNIGTLRSHGKRFYTGIALLAEDNEALPGHWMDT